MNRSVTQEKLLDFLKHLIKIICMTYDSSSWEKVGILVDVLGQTIS